MQPECHSPKVERCQRLPKPKVEGRDACTLQTVGPVPQILQTDPGGFLGLSEHFVFLFPLVFGALEEKSFGFSLEHAAAFEPPVAAEDPSPVEERGGVDHAGVEENLLEEGFEGGGVGGTLVDPHLRGADKRRQIALHMFFEEHFWREGAIYKGRIQRMTLAELLGDDFEEGEWWCLVA